MLNLVEESILLDMEARNKEGALSELAGLLHEQCRDFDTEILLGVLRDREQLGSTGVGNGVALPHGMLNGLDRIRCGFGRSHHGIGFEAIDNQPVHFFFVMFSPLNVAQEYLHTLASASRLLKMPNTRRRLRQASSAREIVTIFQDAPPG